MVLEETPEVEKIQAIVRTAAMTIVFVAFVSSIAGALLIGSKQLIAMLIIMCAFFAQALVFLLQKMDVFKHGPDAVQAKFLRTLPQILLVIGCALAIIG